MLLLGTLKKYNNKVKIKIINRNNKISLNNKIINNKINNKNRNTNSLLKVH